MSEFTKAYDERHGQSGQPIVHNGYLIYPDGAYRENHPMECVLREPPREPLENAKARLRYHDLLLERAQKRFLDEKQRMLQRLTNGGYAPNAVEDLKVLQAEAKKVKRGRDKVQREIDKITAPEREAAVRADALVLQANAHREGVKAAIQELNV